MDISGNWGDMDIIFTPDASLGIGVWKSEVGRANAAIVPAENEPNVFMFNFPDDRVYRGVVVSDCKIDFGENNIWTREAPCPPFHDLNLNALANEPTIPINGKWSFSLDGSSPYEITVDENTGDASGAILEDPDAPKLIIKKVANNTYFVYNPGSIANISIWRLRQKVIADSSDACILFKSDSN